MISSKLEKNVSNMSTDMKKTLERQERTRKITRKLRAELKRKKTRHRQSSSRIALTDEADVQNRMDIEEDCADEDKYKDVYDDGFDKAASQSETGMNSLFHSYLFNNLYSKRFPLLLI